MHTHFSFSSAKFSHSGTERYVERVDEPSSLTLSTYKSSKQIQLANFYLTCEQKKIHFIILSLFFLLLLPLSPELSTLSLRISLLSPLLGKNTFVSLFFQTKKNFASNCFNFFSLSFSSCIQLLFSLCVLYLVFTLAHSELLLINQQPFFYSRFFSVPFFAHARPVEANRLIGLSRGLQLMMTKHQMKRFFSPLKLPTQHPSLAGLYCYCV